MSGSYAYVISEQDDALVIMDISNPSNPEVKSVNMYPDGNGPQEVFVSGNYAYITFKASGKIKIYDI